MRRLRRRAAASAPASPLTPETATAELRITGLSHRWANGQTVLDDCNLVIPKPGLWMLVGCNGSGKSTLFRLIAGLIEPQSGSISTDHQSALVFQNPDHQLLLPSCSSDLLLGMDQGLGNSERRERIRLRLEELGLAGLERRPIHALSVVARNRDWPLPEPWPARRACCCWMNRRLCSIQTVSPACSPPFRSFADDQRPPSQFCGSPTGLRN